MASLRDGHRVRVNMMQGFVEEEVRKQFIKALQYMKDSGMAFEALPGGTSGTVGMGSRYSGQTLMGLPPGAFTQTAMSGLGGHTSAGGRSVGW